MARFQYTRFETIYDNREQAIELLSGLSRLYAETVAVKYYDNLGNICIILGLYKSTAPGDFEISYETKESSGSLPRVFTVKRVDNQSNAECIVPIVYSFDNCTISVANSRLSVQSMTISDTSQN